MEIQIREGNREQKRKLRVCAYCRVSTDADEQENSLENQIRHYETVIKANPSYEYAGVYSDFAISGFKEKRPGLQKMLADAQKGKIDLILTKSVSRFARNTAIVLEATRKLKELNVGVFFELQNINTLSGEGELMLTILAAFAQAESESGSAGAKMVYQRKYEAGIPVQYLERSFGYMKDERGVYIADESEAVWVRKIYEMAADGYTPAAIKRYLNENGVKTVGGTKWIDSTVFRLIENEIYKGDYIMHKHFVNEERKLVRNRGEVDAWYIEDDHEAIVSPELWQKAQDAIEAKEELAMQDTLYADIEARRKAELAKTAAEIEEKKAAMEAIGFDLTALSALQSECATLLPYVSQVEAISQRESQLSLIRAKIEHLKSDISKEENRLAEVKLKVTQAETEQSIYAKAFEEHVHVMSAITVLDPWVEKEY